MGLELKLQYFYYELQYETIMSNSLEAKICVLGAQGSLLTPPSDNHCAGS